ncbi:hypothetical protein DXX93_05680 [Thalassotalea euphylliae]|uniref:Sulfotransferase n=1 Tax=Thalassotalea euphylliae TaxID=1655234 RepID=A0A3E0TNH8_9GAMM|nr:sulfotransferase family 2 domain-containing protein [Thalassotalea euphylliae]REL26116.1 hypothetical protein DXX93_05680 [Thalassotalea euphylliae]
MICHQQKCLFIHIPKAAGQSVESVFVEKQGLTWQERAPLLLRANSEPKLGPPRLAHLTAQEYIDCGHISKDLFQAYFKFSFVRNPWARLVSEYKYRRLHGDKAYQADFKTFLFRYFPKPSDDDYINHKDYYRHVLPQSHFLFDENGHQLVDYIGKFERLQHDFDYVCKAIGLSQTMLPHKNTSKAIGVKQRLKLKLSQLLPTAQPKKAYQEYYDSESREFVAELYAQDIENFNYQFNNES